MTNLSEGGDGVRFHFEVTDIEIQFEVESASLTEGLNQIPQARVVVVTADDVELRDLLSKPCELTIGRGEEVRHFRGIVFTASKQGTHESVRVTFRIAPSLGLLQRNCDSRIFQGQTVPKIIRELLEQRGRGTKLDDQLEREYHPHEYVVQHSESDWTFIVRLMQEEGICCTFVHDKDDETLVLFDKTGNRPCVRESDSGRVPFMEPGRFDGGHEAVTFAGYHEEVGPTEVELRDYDWTNPGLSVKSRRETDRGRAGGVEVYDGHLSQRMHRYEAPQYRAHTIDEQADLVADQLELRRQRWSLEATVVSAEPGRWLEVTGHPDALDGRYLIVGCTGGGDATAGSTGRYGQSMDVVPLDASYRPPRTMPVPVALPVTAKVVGPAGEEIHTDEHGRVKVQFHWDREGSSNEHSSCWLRVAQTWAGAGWGAWILPRIDMEVLVTFLEGDPDRPLVTGCVYNGDNRTPYTLPDEKTKSTLKSNSSPGGGGFNELRFEDKAGSEEIWIHAQKDFNELVLNDHNTRVNHCQTNTVDVDQTELIKHDQSLEVRNNRDKIVKVDENTKVGQNRTESVGNDEKVTIQNDRTHIVQHDDTLHVENSQSTRIDHGQLLTVGADSRITNIAPNDITTVEQTSQTSVGTEWKVDCHDTRLRLNPHTIEGKSPVSINFDSGDGAAVFNLMGAGGLANLVCESSIVLSVGSSSIAITSSEIRISSGTVKIDGSNQVLINS